MYCPRHQHFVRFNPNGKVTCCGHMVNAKLFDSYQDLEQSEWLQDIIKKFNNDQWVPECDRCKQTEDINGTSIRLNSIQFHKIQKKTDYLTVGGVLDNICNSACQFCSQELSTKIGGLTSKNYPIIDNSNKFWSLPLDRVVHLDINGGEPSASKNYREVLQNPPKNVKSIRINTNCSLVLTELDALLEQGIHVTVTVSFDGIENVHNYVRWPIAWDKFYNNLMAYKNMGVNLNLWTTVNALNVADFDNIIKFKNEHQLEHSWALLNDPEELDIRYENFLTTKALGQLTNLESLPLVEVLATKGNNEKELKKFIRKQDKLRKIKFKDYYK